VPNVNLGDKNVAKKIPSATTTTSASKNYALNNNGMLKVTTKRKAAVSTSSEDQQEQMITLVDPLKKPKLVKCTFSMENDRFSP